MFSATGKAETEQRNETRTHCDRAHPRTCAGASALHWLRLEDGRATGQRRARKAKQPTHWRWSWGMPLVAWKRPTTRGFMVGTRHSGEHLGQGIDMPPATLTEQLPHPQALGVSATGPAPCPSRQDKFTARNTHTHTHARTHTSLCSSQVSSL